jgi:hypothetical protein
MRTNQTGRTRLSISKRSNHEQAGVSTVLENEPRAIKL